ncbi:MAG: enoyl-CoA hydratase/isomerase family protein [Thermoleophilaceae bacterium]|nr:enoyl-CoA hydratase/isomerase family protein [Thermoleophilaceae bacterium]
MRSVAASFERDGGVGVVVIDHGELNLFDEQMGRELPAAIEEAAASDIRALVIRAEGGVFTGGVDVHGFEGLSQSEGAELFDHLVRLVHMLEDMELPVIASVHGLCLTWGLELSLGADMIWAAEGAQFGLVERVVGLTPGAGGTQRMAERAGPARAREFVMTGGLYPAEMLERWNVINRVLPAGELQAKTMKFAHQLADGPTVAHAATKKIVRAQVEEGTRGADARIGEYAAALFETEDLQNAVKSFLKDGLGKASFEGR